MKVIVQDNQIAMGTTHAAHSRAPLEEVATIYGVRRFICNGNNILETSFDQTGDGQLALEPRWLTRLVDALPLLQTKEPSSINITGEFAQLLPGHTETNAFQDERRDLRRDGRDLTREWLESRSNAA